MATTTAKKNVMDIAALFGDTISVKKIKMGSRILERRNSEILRRKKKELRNIEAIDEQQKQQVVDDNVNINNIFVNPTNGTHPTDTMRNKTKAEATGFDMFSFFKVEGGSIAEDEDEEKQSVSNLDYDELSTLHVNMARHGDTDNEEKEAAGDVHHITSRHGSMDLQQDIAHEAHTMNQVITQQEAQTMNGLMEEQYTHRICIQTGDISTARSSVCAESVEHDDSDIEYSVISSSQSAETETSYLSIPIYDDDNDHDSDADDLDIDIDQFINQTYGGWRHWSRSSYLSSIDIDECEPGEDARSSVCDESAADDDYEHEHGQLANENIAELPAEDTSQIETDDTLHLGCGTAEKLKHLQEIGAIRTREYLANQLLYSESNTAATNTQTIPNLFGADPDYISSDNDCDSNDDEEDDYIDIELLDDSLDVFHLIDTEEEDAMTVNDLLTRFGIYAFSEDYNIYKYFHRVLGIRYCSEMIDFLPIKIRKPNHCFHLKTLMKLNKMCKYISLRVMDGQWTGRKRKEWIELETNCVFHVFQPRSCVMNVCGDKDIECNHDAHTMKLSGYEKKYFASVNVNALDDKDMMSFKVTIRQLPDPYRFEPKLCKIGVECNNESISITDRLTVRRNENYIDSMFIGKFVENGSQIMVNLSRDDCEYINFNLCHNPKGQHTAFDHKTFNKQFKIKMDLNDSVFIKLFIEQYRGNGVYLCE